MQVLASLAPSSQTVGSLKRTTWLGKPDRKIAKLFINNLQFAIFAPQKRCLLILLLGNFLPNSFFYR